MIKKVEEIVRDVRVCLDRNEADLALIESGDEETLLLDDIIRSKIAESVDRVHLAAPYWMLEPAFKNYSSGEFNWKVDDNCGHVVLPDGFLRLVKFEVSDWERPVHETISRESAEYRLQRSRVRALRGTPQRPVCAIGTSEDGVVLEFYSSNAAKESVTASLEYIARAKITKDADTGKEVIEVSEQCYEAVVYTAAWLVQNSTGENEQGERMHELAMTLLKR